MLTINIPYQGKELSFEFPTDWNEIEKEEILQYCQPLKDESKANLAKVDLLLFMLRFRSENCKGLPKDWMLFLDAEDTYLQAMPLLDFMYNGNNLTKQLFPNYTINGVEMYGPTEAFNNLTVGEYEEAGIYRQLYTDTKNEDFLEKMVSVIYRPLTSPNPSPNGEGKRKSYDPKDENKHVAFIGASRNFLAAVFVWFVGCQNLLVQQFPKVFKSDGQSEPDMMGFTKTIHAGAGPKNGTRDEVRNLDVKDFLFDLQCEIEAAEEMQRKMEEKK